MSPDAIAKGTEGVLWPQRGKAKRKDLNVSIQPLNEQQNVWELDLQRGSRWGEPQLLPASGV